MKTDCRMAFVLTYAHFEGYVVYAATQYMYFVRSQGFDLKKLEDGFVASALHAKLRECASSNTRSSFEEVLGVLAGSISASPSAAVIDAQGNLNFKVLENILYFVGVPSTLFELRRNYINESLLKKRNDIAHGKLLIIDATEVEVAVDFVIEAIEKIRGEITNRAIQKMYLRV